MSSAIPQHAVPPPGHQGSPGGLADLRPRPEGFVQRADEGRDPTPHPGGSSFLGGRSRTWDIHLEHQLLGGHGQQGLCPQGPAHSRRVTLMAGHGVTGAATSVT